MLQCVHRIEVCTHAGPLLLRCSEDLLNVENGKTNGNGMVAWMPYQDSMPYTSITCMVERSLKIHHERT